MAKRHPLKITVIKRLSSKEVYGHPLPEVSETMTAYCDRPVSAPGPGTISIPRSPASASAGTSPG
jgi:hypothetical protein